LILNPNLNPNC